MSEMNDVIERLRNMHKSLNYGSPCDCWDGERIDCGCGNGGNLCEMHVWLSNSFSARELTPIIRDLEALRDEQTKQEADHEHR